MCLEFGSWFGGRNDYGRRRGNHGYWPTPVNQQPPTVAVHDGPPKADGGGHGGHAYLQDKAGSGTPWHNKAGIETPWHNKVGNNAGYGVYTPRHHETAAEHREHADAAMDYQYPTITTTTLARYQVASR